MKLNPMLAASAAIAVVHIGYASADINARQASSTAMGTPTMMSTMMSTQPSTAVCTLTSGATAPGSCQSVNTNRTSAKNLTVTLGGIRPSVTLSGSLTESLSIPRPNPTPNVGATPVGIGAGMAAAVLGIIAAL
ncbi:hypothetical protein AAE478_008481 [Parahypoxylon ruwenzoriense]